MHETRTKIKFVFLPMIRLAITTIAGYLFVYWLLHIHWAILPLKQDVLHLWVPIGLSFLWMLLFMRGRLHLLKLDPESGSPRTGYYFIGALYLFLPLIFLLPLVDKATGKLELVQYARDIATKKARYYKPDSLFAKKDAAGWEEAITRSGKRNETLNFKKYAAIPVMNNSGDTVALTNIFIGIKYHEQHSSNISSERRGLKWVIFSDLSAGSFDRLTIDFRYLERMPNTKDRDYLLQAAKQSRLYKRGTIPIILEMQDERFDDRMGNRLMYALLAFGIGSIVWFIMIVIPGIYEERIKAFSAAPDVSAMAQLRMAFAAAMPRKDFAATPILIWINCLVFIIMVFAGYGFIEFQTADLFHAGGLYKPAVQQGQWWRLITAIFIHGGLMHLLMNMFGLLLAGVIAEESLGLKKFLLVYIIGGIGAGLFSMNWYNTPVLAVGASGAIFSLQGLMLAFVVFKKFEAGMRGAVLFLLIFTAGYSLLVGFFTAGIDNSAHLAGLAIGFILGFFLRSNISFTDSSWKKMLKTKK